MTPQDMLTLALLVISGIGAVFVALRAVLKAWRELRADLLANTADTLMIKDMTNRIRLNLINQDELDTLRRWKKAFDSLPECQSACRDRIEQLVDERRIRPVVYDTHAEGHHP
jgi:hypothetical protein